MKKLGILFAVMVLLTVVGIVQAEDAAAPPVVKDNGLHGYFDVTYASRYIWRGFDLYNNNHGAIQPSVDVDLFGSGFGVNVFYSRSTTASFEEAQWLVPTIYYTNKFFANESYATHYKVAWSFYDFPHHVPGRDLNAQEISGAFWWPKLLPWGLVPSYTIVCMWPDRSGSATGDLTAGWAHIFGLGYDWVLPAIMPETKEQVIHLSAQAVYNDGVGPAPHHFKDGDNVDHDWSHAVFGATTDFPITKSLVFIPGAYYQNSWDESVNSQDEFWVTLSLRYLF
ncbi:MAG: hypothetical protein NTW55_03780 [Planctomycetota bacterium]|nr:hypothetical protein [Planctomycetota bacterium]